MLPLPALAFLSAALALALPPASGSPHQLGDASASALLAGPGAKTTPDVWSMPMRMFTMTRKEAAEAMARAMAAGLGSRKRKRKSLAYLAADDSDEDSRLIRAARVWFWLVSAWDVMD